MIMNRMRIIEVNRYCWMKVVLVLFTFHFSLFTSTAQPKQRRVQKSEQQQPQPQQQPQSQQQPQPQQSQQPKQNQRKNPSSAMSVRAQISFPTAVDMPEEVVWRRDIYRELDLSKDANAGLYYPVEPQLLRGAGWQVEG